MVLGAMSQHQHSPYSLDVCLQDIILLTDDQASQDAWPTKANMTRQMQRLVHDARPGDSLIFHFSGAQHFYPAGIRNHVPKTKG